MNKFSRALSVVAISCSFWMALHAQQPSPAAGGGVPRLVKFSGTVKAATGQNLAGTTGLTFAVYQNQLGGAALWIETQNVELDSQGNYTVLLGSTKSDGLPMDLFMSGESRWLGVQAQGQDEQARILLVSVPYALKAADAETLGGKPLSAFVLTDPQPSTTSSGSTTTVTTTSSSATADSGQRIISRLAATVGGGGTQNFIAKWDSSGVNLMNTSAPIYDDGSGHVGFGTTTPAYLLDVNGNAQINGAQFINSGGGYTHWDLPYNMNLISAGNNYTGFGYNWQYLFNSGSPFLNKPAPDSSMWMQFSNTQISFNYNTSTTVGAMTSTPAAVIQNNGNVGIGTTTPTSRLHVFSNTGADANYTFENASAGFGSYFTVKSNSPFAAAVIQSSDGKWAFGRFGGNNSFQIQDLTNNKQPFVIEGNPANNSFYITAAGNVGLGTYQPQNKLDVLGGAALGTYGGVNAAPANGLIVSGNTGIGTATPSQKLEVAGTAKVNTLMFADATSMTTAATGTISAVNTAAGSGLTGGATSGAANLSLVTTCSGGQTLNWTGSAWACTTPAAGTITGVTAGLGLTGGGASGSVGLALTAAQRTRAITYIAGCDSCSLLATTDSEHTIFSNVIGSMTINSVTCFSDVVSGTQPTINIARNGTNILSSDLTCSNTGAVSTSFVVSPSIMSQGDTLDFVNTAAGVGAARRVTVAIQAVVN